jgi:hypothetical protein
MAWNTSRPSWPIPLVPALMAGKVCNSKPGRLSTGVRREIVIVLGRAEQENLSAAKKLPPADVKNVDWFPRIVPPRTRRLDYDRKPWRVRLGAGNSQGFWSIVCEGCRDATLSGKAARPSWGHRDGPADLHFSSWANCCSQPRWRLRACGQQTGACMNTDALRRAALVRKPARSEWAPKSDGESNPADAGPQPIATDGRHLPAFIVLTDRAPAARRR